jgi:hypothetical protein
MTACIVFAFETRVREAWIALGGRRVPLVDVANSLGLSQREIREALPHIPNLNFESICWNGVETLLRTQSNCARMLGFPEDGYADEIADWLITILWEFLDTNRHFNS